MILLARLCTPILLERKTKLAYLVDRAISTLFRRRNEATIRAILDHSIVREISLE